MDKTKRCLDRISELQNSALSFMIGSGTSVSSGLPTWDQLIAPYIQELDLKDQHIPYERILQYALDSNTEYNDFLYSFKSVSDSCKPKPLHRLIAKLNVPRIWTTNYDGLLEKAYRDEMMGYQIVAEDNDIHLLDYSRNQIIKMHGSLTDEKQTDIVLLENEYENYIDKRNAIYHLLKNDIKTKTFLYFGFSFNDSNIRRIVSSAWNYRSRPIGRPSYLFTVPPKDDSKKPLYKCWKKDLQRYNIDVIEMKDYIELDVFLYELLKARAGKNIVLIGKSDSDDFNKLAFQIGYELAAAGFCLHSGGGPNLSVSMSEGIWKYLEDKSLNDNNRVRFYYRYNGGSTNPKRGHVYYCGHNREEVRKKMISTNTVCIVMGDEETIDNGMLQEIDIAKTKGARIIPIASTGKLSLKTWEANYQYFSKDGVFSDLEQEYLKLNSSESIEEIAKVVVKLADQLMVRSY